jgi:prepilin-type N-terminal cleavage/methylation domain-containing protein
MQIFSPLHTQSSSRGGTYDARLGFTLIELLISVGIIGLVSSVILVKYNSFDSTILLKSAAYEVAISLREVQVKSVSVSQSGNDFDNPYGIQFIPNSKTYTAYTVTGGTDNPPRHNPPNSTVVGGGTLTRTMYIADICVYGTALADPCNVDQLDISFKRPEFKALFYAVSGSNTYTNAITSTVIKIGPPSASGKHFLVVVSQLGQISVTRE